MIEGLRRFELARHADERGWFSELARASRLPKPIRQLNLSRSRRGMVRVVVLDRTTGEVFSEDIGDDNPVAIYVPGINAHGYEALTDVLFAYLVTEEYDAADPDEHGVPWDDRRVKHIWSAERPILSARDAST
jgi:dTDP-4-dehydrorhamnose 3,5-epimerase-like enzyme